MKLIVTALITLTMISCAPKFGKISSKRNCKFSKWMVVEKYEVDDTACIYYWNRGMNSFTDRCDIYDVGDTIKHH
jgi:hypothetical protein